MFEVTSSAAQAPHVVAAPDEVGELTERVTARSGRPALSDQHRLAVEHDRTDRHVAVARTDGLLAGFAQLVAGNEASSLEVVTDPEVDRDEIVPALVGALVALADGPVQWWWSAPTADDDALVRRLGVSAERRLLQMRRSLPLDHRVDVSTRAFRVGADEDTWLAVNNRAFAEHAEQGAWTIDDLAAREAEAWFDPEGFRLHERDGRLAAFCWTKVHVDTDPVLGEIYVIGVDPDFQGLGLGRQLTLAGLASIAERGVTHGMLHVDEDNVAAVGLYRALGFDVHHVDVAYTISAGTPA